MPCFSSSFPFICMHVVVAEVWGSLCNLAERLDGSQFGGGAANEEEGEALAGMAASSICITWVSGGCSLTYRPSVSFISKEHKAPMDASARAWRHNGNTHKGRGIPGFYSLPLRVLETHIGQSGPVWPWGSIPGAKTGLENSFCVYVWEWRECSHKTPCFTIWYV